MIGIQVLSTAYSFAIGRNGKLNVLIKAGERQESLSA
jgi:hypothetical protein